MTRFLSKLFGKTVALRHAPKPAARTRLGVESLDRRDLPSVTANLVWATGQLTITGDNLANHVTISELPYASVNVLLLAGVNSVTVDGRPCDATILTTFVRSLNVSLGG